MPSTTFYRLFLCCWLVSLLAGCGFHLRGQADLPMDLAMHIQDSTAPGEPPSRLRRELERILVTNGVTVTDDPEAADAVLKILREDLRRRTIATGPDGEIREYELRYTVDYALTRPDGQDSISQDTISVARDLLYSEARVLGRTAGEQITIRDMTSDLAYSILRRVQATGFDRRS